MAAAEGGCSVDFRRTYRVARFLGRREGISGGQKQRLAIARCLLRRRRVLLLDEATANIDEDTERQIMENVRAAFPDLLIIAVSHRASMRSHATATLGL